jgi:hypothetical protein
MLITSMCRLIHHIASLGVHESQDLETILKKLFVFRNLMIQTGTHNTALQNLTDLRSFYIQIWCFIKKALMIELGKMLVISCSQKFNFERSTFELCSRFLAHPVYYMILF